MFGEPLIDMAACDQTRIHDPYLYTDLISGFAVIAQALVPPDSPVPSHPRSVH